MADALVAKADAAFAEKRFEDAIELFTEVSDTMCMSDQARLLKSIL